MDLDKICSSLSKRARADSTPCVLLLHIGALFGHCSSCGFSSNFVSLGRFYEFERSPLCAGTGDDPKGWIRRALRALDLLPREAPPHVVELRGGADLARGGADLARAARV